MNKETKRNQELQTQKDNLEVEIQVEKVQARREKERLKLEYEQISKAEKSEFNSIKERYVNYVREKEYHELDNKGQRDKKIDKLMNEIERLKEKILNSEKREEKLKRDNKSIQLEKSKIENKLKECELEKKKIESN